MNGVLQPVISDELLKGDDKHRVVKFDRTPIMSTYLLAMIVGEYDYVEARDSDGVLVRVYTPVGKKEQGEFALNVSVYFVTDDVSYTVTLVVCVVFVMFMPQIQIQFIELVARRLKIKKLNKQ